jgi:OmpA-OmpF porin, OOP family
MSMKKHFLISMAVMTISLNAWSQTADTLIYAEGKIINGITKEAVSASISYQSLPYGNRVGILNGNTYKFPLFEKEKYSITVEAIGFAPAKYILDPATANNDLKVIKDIELGLPLSASVAAETTHTIGKVMRLENLIFAQGRAKISPESYPELDKVLTMLINYPEMVIRLEGHTDYLGNPKDNLKLSQERVDAVKTYLISKGANKTRVKTKAYGGTSPISRENTESAHSMNRRVEVRILEN